MQMTALTDLHTLMSEFGIFCLSKKWVHYSPKMTINETKKTFVQSPVCSRSHQYPPRKAAWTQDILTSGTAWPMAQWLILFGCFVFGLLQAVASAASQAMTALVTMQAAAGTPSPWFPPCYLMIDTLQFLHRHSLSSLLRIWFWQLPVVVNKSEKYILCALNIILILCHLATRIVFRYFKATAVP